MRKSRKRLKKTSLRAFVLLTKWGMPIRLRRILARQQGNCLRCFTRPLVKWQRCEECLATHSLRANR